ncbi:MAG: hypothetical protein V4692_09150 [Bdellovibrionota bacterium]
MPAQKASAKASKSKASGSSKAKPAVVSKSKSSAPAKAVKAKPKVSAKPVKAAKPVAMKAAKKPEAKAAAKPDKKPVNLAAVSKAPVKGKPVEKPVGKSAGKTSEKPAEKAAKGAGKLAKAQKPTLVSVEEDSAPLLPPEPEVDGEELVEEAEQPRHVVSLREAMEKPITEKKKKKDELKIDRTGDLETQWKTLFEKSKSVKPLPYKMSESYDARTPLQHKVLGWGYVLTSQNNRLEVLFKDGIKFLISNYKS